MYYQKVIIIQLQVKLLYFEYIQTEVQRVPQSVYDVCVLTARVKDVKQSHYRPGVAQRVPGI